FFRSYHVLALIGAYFLGLYVLGWGWVVQQLCTWGQGADATLMPGAELLLLVPFLAGLVASWAFFYDVERALHESTVPLFVRPFWGRWTYVAFHARQNLALI